MQEILFNFKYLAAHVQVGEGLHTALALSASNCLAAAPGNAFLLPTIGGGEDLHLVGVGGAVMLTILGVIQAHDLYT